MDAGVPGPPGFQTRHGFTIKTSGYFTQIASIDRKRKNKRGYHLKHQKSNNFLAWLGMWANDSSARYRSVWSQRLDWSQCIDWNQCLDWSLCLEKIYNSKLVVSSQLWKRVKDKRTYENTGNYWRFGTVYVFAVEQFSTDD
ncbi:unnamed protein product [Macrosiphum euphorbiae]|uniref:Uncharacterized protein n=1 Tax=Macrosiphum euphorbiae TaxID=13131 RepID=A0AAV0X9J1_9HEMI|nr:unnamed protein product [Macrosiphum euphorbiae]